ncbi:MAG: hypothetical protein IIA89_12115 [Chloroflexi bacterium]|nr:hypothetical protein [Chloroflexota bacterium]
MMIPIFCPLCEPDILEIMTAFGTCGATVIALVSILYIAVIRPWMSRPSLEIRYLNKRDPYITTGNAILTGSPPPAMTSPAIFIRVGVENTSKTAARNVSLKFSRLADRDKVKNSAFVPYDMNWADTGGSNRAILAPKEEGLIDLFLGLYEDPESWWFQPWDIDHSLHIGNISGLPTSPDEPLVSYIELIAYAENLAKPKVVVFEVTYAQIRTYTKFQMKPVKAKIRTMREIMRELQDQKGYEEKLAQLMKDLGQEE